MNPDRILKGSLKSVIHSWDVTPANISKIRLGVEDLRTRPTHKFDVNDQIPPCMDHFEPLSQEKVKNIINTSPSKSCNIDSRPTTLLNKILPSVSLYLLKSSTNC